MNCPRCGKTLLQEKKNGVITFFCPSGCGRYMTVAALRACGAASDTVNSLLFNARMGNTFPGIPCPGCKKIMQQLKIGTDVIYFDLDICTGCYSLWFDAGEIEHFPLPNKKIAPEINPALAALEPITTGNNHLSDGDGPDQFWKIIPGIAGLPVEQYSLQYRRLPLITWGIAAICIGIYLMALWQGSLNNFIRDWSIIPDQWQRFHGITLLTSAFLHAGALHLICNMYFLLMCGDNVEDTLGHWKYAMLIILSESSASALYVATAAATTVPCIGASGFICGIIAFYAVAFPQNPISFWLPSRSWILSLSSGTLWFSIPAWLCFVIYAGGQLLYATFAVDSSIAFFAHIGGFIPGIIFAIAYKIKSSTMEMMEHRWYQKKFQQE